MPEPTVSDEYTILKRAARLVADELDLGEPPAGPISRAVPRGAHVADRALLQEPRVQQYRAELAVQIQPPAEAARRLMDELRPRLHEHIVDLAGLPRAIAPAFAGAAGWEFSDEALRKRADRIDVPGADAAGVQGADVAGNPAIDRDGVAGGPSGPVAAANVPSPVGAANVPSGPVAAANVPSPVAAANVPTGPGRGAKPSTGPGGATIPPTGPGGGAHPPTGSGGATIPPTGSGGGANPPTGPGGGAHPPSDRTDLTDADFDVAVAALDECHGVGEFRQLPFLVGPRLFDLTALRTAGQLAYVHTAGGYVFPAMDSVATRASTGRLDERLDIAEDGYALDGLVCWDGQGTAYRQQLSGIAERLLGTGPNGNRQVRVTWAALRAALHTWLCDGDDSECQRTRVDLAADAFREQIAASVHTFDAPIVQQHARRFLVAVAVLRRLGSGSVWGAIERYAPGGPGWEASARRALTRAAAIDTIFRSLESDDLADNRARLARAVAVLDATSARGRGEEVA